MNAFLTVLGAKSDIRVPAWANEAPLLLQFADFSLYPHMVEEIREPSGVSFIKALIPSMRALLS